jgi:hypothetical protein
MEDISGQHEVTNAQVPPGVTAASAITLLQEADDTRLGLAMTDYEEGLGKIGTKILELVNRYYTDSRMIKIAGDDGSWQIFDFRNTDLRDSTHVEVQAGSSFPSSQAAKQAMMRDLVTMITQTGNGLHGRQLAQFMRDLGLGATDHLIQEYTANETQVNRENVLLMQGKPLPINDYDDTQAHLDGHTDKQKSASYAQAPPQVKAAFEQHVALHRQKQQQEQQEQIQQQAQMAAAQSGQPPPDQQAQMQAAQAGQQIAGDQQQQQLDLQSHQQDMQQAQLQQLIQAAQGAQDGQQARQSQRHADEEHAMKMHAHAQNERRAQEQHEARLQSMRNQSRGGR